jgi:hypothetical protein
MVGTWERRSWGLGSGFRNGSGGCELYVQARSTEAGCFRRGLQRETILNNADCHRGNANLHPMPSRSRRREPRTLTARVPGPVAQATGTPLADIISLRCLLLEHREALDIIQGLNAPLGARGRASTTGALHPREILDKVY